MRRVIALGLLPLVMACSTTSTISQVNAPNIEGDIVGGSRSSIFVATDGGGEYEIPRNQVTSIDYPGNVHTGIGAGVLAYGVLNIAVGLPECQDRRQDQAAYCIGVFTPAVIGAALMTWGLIVNQGQKANAADNSRASRVDDEEPGGGFPSWTSKRPAKAGETRPGVLSSPRPAEELPAAPAEPPATPPAGAPVDATATDGAAPTATEPTTAPAAEPPPSKAFPPSE